MDVNKFSVDDTNEVLPSLENELQIESVLENTDKKIDDVQDLKGVHSYIGLEADEIEKLLGKPVRIDRSSYDYDWWIYNEDFEQYIQIGIEKDKVVTVYAIGDKLDLHPFKIGQSLKEIENNIPLTNKISFHAQNNSYRFELNETEMLKMPLVELDHVFVQLYFDTFTNKLSSVRYMNSETLVKQRPYELIYRGDLISAKELIDEEWKEVEKGNQAQILDITNVIRKRHDLPSLKWDKTTAEVAYNHSKDMNQNNYFSHKSPTTGGLADRLAEGEVIYQLAGENIAALYVDGIAAVEGWLNSEGHRETLLNEKFTHLGVGVFEKHYTQNFVQKWE
ncbi:CAP domain-containing protein [Bacillus sp. PS06]|nr:CAP domain-containing protein [Bacillus sp. PS06]